MHLSICGSTRAIPGASMYNWWRIIWIVFILFIQSRKISAIVRIYYERQQSNVRIDGNRELMQPCICLRTYSSVVIFNIGRPTLSIPCWVTHSPYDRYAPASSINPKYACKVVKSEFLLILLVSFRTPYKLFSLIQNAEISLIQNEVPNRYEKHDKNRQNMNNISSRNCTSKRET